MGGPRETEAKFHDKASPFDNSPQPSKQMKLNEKKRSHHEEKLSEKIKLADGRIAYMTVFMSDPSWGLGARSMNASKLTKKVK